MSEELKLSENWTDEIAANCSKRCADEFGDPPCWSLAGDEQQGETPLVIEPCDECQHKGTDNANNRSESND